MPWSDGRCLVWDVTCPDTLAPSHLDTAVTGPGSVATHAETNKRVKYSSLPAAYVFAPIGIETFGALGDDASVFLQDLGRRIAFVTQEPRSFLFFMQRISVDLQRGNAAHVLGTVVSSDKLDELF